MAMIKPKHSVYDLLIDGLIERFSRHYKNDPISGCWVWTSGLNKYGYGKFKLAGKTLIASRAAKEIFHGMPDDSDMLALHKCDNPSCVNPKHIYWGTAKDNAEDIDRRNRRVTLRGEDAPWSKLTEKDVFEIRYLIKNKKMSQNLIAEKFDMSQEAISKIKRRLTWGHL